MGTVVLQYPPWFKDTPRNRDFLLLTKDLVPDLSLSIEFRDSTWHKGDVLGFLEREQFGHVAFSLYSREELSTQATSHRKHRRSRSVSS